MKTMNEVLVTSVLMMLLVGTGCESMIRQGLEFAFTGSWRFETQDGGGGHLRLASLRP